MLRAMGDDARHLNFGAGTPAPGWWNLDSSPWFRLPRGVHRLLAAGGNARAQAFCDAPYAFFRYWPGTPLPFDGAVLEAIYCSHVLEHLPTAHVQPLLDEFRRVLAPGGRLRILVPDLESSLRDLIAGDAPFASLDAALGTLPEVLTGAGAGADTPVRPCPRPDLRTRVRAAMEGFFGFPSCHRTAYFRATLREHLEKDWQVETGLAFRESGIDADRLAAVEQASRCENALVWELTKR